MRHAVAASLLLLGFVFSTCKDGDPEPKDDTLLTVNLDADYFSGSQEIWYVAWDNNGTLLDFEKYIPATQLKLTMAADTELVTDKITVGQFVYRPNSNAHTITIFTDFEPGTTIELHTPPKTEPLSETFSVTVPGLNLSLVISRKYGSLQSSSGETYTSYIDPRVTKYHLTYRDITGAYYKQLTNIKANDHIQLTKEDFKLYENTASFNLPPSYEFVNIRLHGLEDDQVSTNDGGYYLDYNSSTASISNASTLELGYPDDMNKFIVIAASFFDDGMIEYRERGDLPANIEWPDKQKYTLVSGDPYAPKIAATGPVKWIRATWNHVSTDPNTGPDILTVTSPQLNPKIGQPPAEMLSERPEFAYDKDFYNYSSISVVVDNTQTYDEMLSDYVAGVISVETRSATVTLTENQ